MDKSMQPHRLFIIRNWLMRPEWMAMPPRAAAIINRAVFTLVKWQALGDVFRLYALCRRDGIDFNLAYIPDYFISSTTQEFNRKEMNRLFKLGYELARPGYHWRKVPPGMDGENPAVTRPATGRAVEKRGD